MCRSVSVVFFVVVRIVSCVHSLLCYLEILRAIMVCVCVYLVQITKQLTTNRLVFSKAHTFRTNNGYYTIYDYVVFLSAISIILDRINGKRFETKERSFQILSTR